MTGLIAVFLFVLLIAASGVIAFLLIAYFQAKAQRTEVDGQLAHVQQTLEQVKSHAQNAYDTYRSAAESKIRELSASVQKTPATQHCPVEVPRRCERGRKGG